MMMKGTTLNITSKFLFTFIYFLLQIYYRGRELQKRLAERVKEAEADSRDRQKEKEEIEELKNKIFSGEHEDPSAEFEKVYSYFTYLNFD